MGKGQRRKQVCIPFEKTDDLVSLDYDSLNLLVSSTEISHEIQQIGIPNFLTTLSVSQSLNDQLKVIQQTKGPIKSALTQLMNSGLIPSLSTVECSFTCLIHLFLHHTAFPLRKAFDWLPEFLSRFRCLHPSRATSMLQSVFHEIINSWEIKLNDPSNCSIEELLGISYSFNCLSMLDKEVPCFENEKSPETASVLLFRFMNVIGIVSSHCASIVMPSENDSPSNGSEFMRHTEVFGECMRAVVNVLKPRPACLLPPDLVSIRFENQSTTWGELYSLYSLHCSRMLCSEVVGRDVVTAAAMGLTCIQWLFRLACNTRETKSVSKTSEQLLAWALILDFSDPSPSTQTTLAPALLQFASDAGLPSSLLSSLASMPLVSKCALLRGVVSVYGDSDLYLSLSSFPLRDRGLEGLVPISGSGSDGSLSRILFFGPLVTSSITASLHSNPNLRLYGLQVLEAWFNRLECSLQDPSSSLLSQLTQTHSLVEFFSLLRHISSVLLSLISHPSRQISHMVPTVYERLLNIVQAIESRTSPQVEFESLFEGLWSHLMAEVLKLPSAQRGRYQALVLLLPKVGAHRIFRIQPDIVQILVNAIQLREVAASICNFLTSLLRLLTSETKSKIESSEVSEPTPERLFDEVRPLWISSVVRALCSKNEKLSTNISHYLIPEVFSFDRLCGPALIDLIRETHSLSLQQRLWGMVNVCLQARLLGFPGGEIAHSSGCSGILANEMRLACLNENDEMRMVALTCLTASQKSSIPLNTGDFEILKETFHHCLKSPSADHRQRVCRVIKALVGRVSETHRIAQRDLKKLEKKQSVLRSDLRKLNTSIEDLEKGIDLNQESSSTQLLDLQQKLNETNDKLSQCEPQFLEFDASTQASIAACEWLSETLFGNLYPGTTFEREVMSLELLHCVFDILSASDNSSSSPLLSYFISESLALTIMNLTVSSWDRSRQLASELLFKFPKPLPGFQSPEVVQSLVAWGKRLACSAKQRESEAGASLLRVVMTVYCSHLGWRVPFSSKSSIQTTPTHPATSAVSKSLASIRCNESISGLCDTVEDCLRGIDQLFTLYRQQASSSSSTIADESDSMDLASDIKESSPLCHGLFHSIRVCLEEANNSKYLSLPQVLSSSDADALRSASVEADASLLNWQPLIQRTKTLAVQAMRSAMSIVAEAASDVPFAPIISSTASPSVAPGSHVPHTASSSPDTNTSADLVKMPINSSTFMAATYMNTNSVMGSATEGDMSDEKSSQVQRAVVAAWLMVKEASSLLSFLVSISPPPVVSVSSLLTIPDVFEIGDLLLDALGRLKHMGAISEAYFALQAIAEHLLRIGERCSELCRLPNQWLSQILSRLSLRGEQQVFILRRSAGFAYSILALLRAEPANMPPTLLHSAMQVLLRTVQSGLLAETQESPETNDSWRMSVHALNSLRLILLDGALGSDLDRYVAQCAEYAVRGFKSSKWAVRNSSMMVFSSMVQRAVDNDKNDSGGARAATPHEFFSRYPTLYPFLLSELTTAVESQGETSAHRGAHQGGIHPSLYPILLLLSKLRAAIDTDSLSTQDISEAASPSDPTPVRVEVSPFIHLVESCRSQPFHQVRAMAARALTSLISIEQVPRKASSLLSQLNYHLSQSTPSRPSTNEIHGSLLQIQEVLFNLNKRVVSKSGPSKKNDPHQGQKVGKNSGKDQVSEGISKVVEDNAFVQSLLRDLRDGFIPALAQSISLLSTHPSSSIQRALLQISQVIHACMLADHDHYHSFSAQPLSDNPLFSIPVHQISEDLLTGQSLVILCSLLRSNRYTVLSASSTSPQTSLVGGLMPYEGQAWVEGLRELTYRSLKNSPSATTSQALSVSWSSQEDVLTYTSSLLSHISLCPFSTLHFRDQLMPLLLHPVSEVREGVVQGLLDYWEEDPEAAQGPSSIFRDESFLSLYLTRVRAEKEPPQQVSTLELLNKILRLNSFSCLSSTCQASLLSLWDSLITLTLDPASLKTKNLTESPALAQTEVASYSLEILGWIVSSAFSSSEPTSSSLPHSSVAQWLEMLEVAGEEDQALSLREAAASCLSRSSLLQTPSFLSFQSALTTKSSLPTPPSLLPGLVLRAWLLALRLMQDDDSDVRALANQAVYSACIPLLRVRNDSEDPEAKNFALLSTDPLYTPTHSYTLKHLLPRGLAATSIWSQLFPPAEDQFPSSSSSSSSSSSKRIRLEDTSSEMPSVQTSPQFLLNSLLESAGEMSEIRSLLLDDGAATQKIFEAEQSNLHSEPLVSGSTLSQALYLHFKMALDLLSSATLSEDSQACVQTSLQSTLSSLHSHLLSSLSYLSASDATRPSSSSSSSAASLSWVGGASFQKEYFVHLYVLLQAACLLSSCTGIPSPSSSVELSQTPSLSTQHPWILSLIQKLQTK